MDPHHDDGNEPEPDLSTFPSSLRGKRILLCTESFGPVNGVSRTTLMLVNHLRANGAIVAVVAPQNHVGNNTFLHCRNGKQPESPNNSLSQQPEQDLKVVRMQGYPLPYNPELSIVYPVRLSQLYARTFGPDVQPDLIYLASPASLGFQVMLQLRQQPANLQIPIIANFQTDLSGYCEILFPPPLSDLAVWTFGTVQGWLFAHKSVRTVFYPSAFVRRYLERTLETSALGRTSINGVEPGVTGTDKLELLQRGVDTVLFHPHKRSESLRRELAPDGEIVLICVARLAPEKGFGFLAQVIQRLDKMQRSDRIRYKMYIVGGNKSPGVEEEIRGLFASQSNDDGRVKFAGFLMGEELATAYASADIFLHCSITETFGLVVLESMASGVPVIARDEGGPSDIVRHSDSGYLVPPDELDLFVERVVSLAKDGELRSRLSLGARKQAEEMGWDRVNNRVAWRMANVIQERADDCEIRRTHEEEESSLLAEADGKADLESGPLESRDGMLPSAIATRVRPGQLNGWKPWIALNDAIQARLVDARLMGGMFAISATWVAVGGYLAFIKLSQWLKKSCSR
ncbi:glycosyltransferase [Rhypophila decipiens]|uniref:Glycosyltransferase n=1 Tax=Rhypophila decipiens TaxID=261697 RepID=A0AAN6XXQ0_9PEZI|nr:glycosyltransferase [Rhypophila decipiens]